MQILSTLTLEELADANTHIFLKDKSNSKKLKRSRVIYAIASLILFILLLLYIMPEMKLDSFAFFIAAIIIVMIFLTIRWPIIFEKTLRKNTLENIRKAYNGPLIKRTIALTNDFYITEGDGVKTEVEYSSLDNISYYKNMLLLKKTMSQQAYVISLDSFKDQEEKDCFIATLEEKIANSRTQSD